jgi:hypothetical protein
MDLDFRQVCKRAHETAKKSGFLENPRPWDEVTNLVHTELAEATEEYRAHRGISEMFYEFTISGTDGVKYTETLTAEAYKALTPEARKAGKPCGIPSELADVVIRIAQQCGTENLDLAGALQKLGDVRPAPTFMNLIALCHRSVSRAFADSDPAPNLEDVTGHLAHCVKLLFVFCEQHGVPLERVIHEKMDFNEGRSYRHGNKKI